jgi:hypothetical protein
MEMPVDLPVVTPDQALGPKLLNKPASSKAVQRPESPLSDLGLQHSNLTARLAEPK